MMVIYAMGGGMGHLQRVRLWLDGMGVRSYRVLTISPYAEFFFPAQAIEKVAPQASPSEVIDRWAALLRLAEVRQCLVDVFPLGLRGELHEGLVPPGVRCLLLVRRLRGDFYFGRFGGGQPMRYHEAYCFEPPDEPTYRWLRTYCETIRDARLPLPTAVPERAAGVLPPEEPGRPRWLVVHSGPAEEVRRLLDHARDQARLEGSMPLFCLATAVKAAELGDMAADVRRIAYRPLVDLYPMVERIVSAAGFNIMRETEAFAHKHLVLPQLRRYDDQFWRARRRAHR